MSWETNLENCFSRNDISLIFCTCHRWVANVSEKSGIQNTSVHGCNEHKQNVSIGILVLNEYNQGLHGEQLYADGVTPFQ
jgi:hypothetical protein